MTLKPFNGSQFIWHPQKKTKIKNKNPYYSLVGFLVFPKKMHSYTFPFNCIFRNSNGIFFPLRLMPCKALHLLKILGIFCYKALHWILMFIHFLLYISEFQRFPLLLIFSYKLSRDRMFLSYSIPLPLNLISVLISN